MTRRLHVSGLVVATTLALTGVGLVHAAQRTFVSTLGNDLNACSLVAPCRGFTRALTQTDPSGEIVVLDSGGYGSVTVDRSVSIVSPSGLYAGITVFPATDGVVVAAPAVRVVLRGLTINGQGGNHGIRVQAGEVHVENTVVSNMAQAGILVEGGSSVRISATVSRSNADGLRVQSGAGAVSVLVRDSEFSNNATAGIGVSPSAAGASALVTVERSSVTKNGIGVVTAPGGTASATTVVTQSVASENAGAGVSSAGSTATVFVRESAITRNGTGLEQQNAGVLNACGANLLAANTAATSGTINTSSCLDVAAASGTVTSVATGAGLTGGPITTTGTISADTAYLQRRVAGACSAGTSIRTINSDGTVACEVDDVGTGTVTSVATGTGLTGGPITGAGTVSIANGGVGNAQLANASVNVAKLDTASTDSRYFRQGGNAFGAVAQLGTSDNNAVELRANGLTAVQIVPTLADPVNGLDTPTPLLIGGWSQNSVTAGVIGASIGGGGGSTFGFARPNRVTDNYGTVGGGWGNTAGNDAGTVRDRTAATVGGGSLNAASGNHSTVAGGSSNTASGNGAAIGGGSSNAASGIDAAIAGGLRNTASGDFSLAAGLDSEAHGDYSVALGRQAIVNSPASGTFQFADNHNFDFATSTANAFRVRATGGVRFVVDIDGAGATTWSCLLTTGNSWSCASDRNLKQDLEPLDGRAVLERLSAMPVYAWSPKGRNSHLRHYGPMAQDFHAAFGLGDDDRMIGMQDADGVALAAIQGLNAKVDEQAAALAERDATVADLRDRLAQVELLRGELAAMKATLAEALAGTSLLARQ